MIHLLPTFLGFAGEDPNKHHNKFHVVCLNIKPIENSRNKSKVESFSILFRE